MATTGDLNLAVDKTSDGNPGTPGRSSVVMDDSGLQEARRRIQETGKSGATFLDLGSLDLDRQHLIALVPKINQLTHLTTLYLQGNQLSSIPRELGGLPTLRALDVTGNPLPPEVLSAAQASTSELLGFLRAVYREGELIHEGKLVLVGEGEVGKSTLLAALRGEDFVENRATTHGIEIKPVTVVNDDGTAIVLNGWDFGGQQIYRPTHQLFFTDPAVYLVVWKPREGPELGLVNHWITMIRHRAGTGARIHVVATHGGPGQRYAHLDEAALRARFGDMIVDFHHVDSKTKHGIDELLEAIGTTAGGIAHISQWYPRSWLELRDAVSVRPDAYLRYDAYEQVATAKGLSITAAGSLARNAHGLGHWIHYADEPSLAEFLVLKVDWLSVAIGFVLDDPPTIDAHGLLPHRRLGEIWNNPARDAAHRYPHHLQQMFLRLMERFELTYRVPELPGGEPVSLVAQLVPAARPDLTGAWDGYRSSDPELRQGCRITERDADRSATPEGLIPRLIVLFHRYSLGRDDVTAAVHWGGGMVLQDRYGARALLTLDPDGLTIRVRGLNPQAFLDHLIHDTREYVDDFWKGLTTQVLVPCQPPCGLDQPGRGLFDLDGLYGRLDRGKSDYPCRSPAATPMWRSRHCCTDSPSSAHLTTASPPSLPSC